MVCFATDGILSNKQYLFTTPSPLLIANHPGMALLGVLRMHLLPLPEELHFTTEQRELAKLFEHRNNSCLIPLLQIVLQILPPNYSISVYTNLFALNYSSLLYAGEFYLCFAYLAVLS